MPLVCAPGHQGQDTPALTVSFCCCAVQNVQRVAEIFTVPIGLEHPDTRKRKPPIANRFQMAYEKPISIRS